MDSRLYLLLSSNYWPKVWILIVKLSMLYLYLIAHINYNIVTINVRYTPQFVKYFHLNPSSAKISEITNPSIIKHKIVLTIINPVELFINLLFQQ